MKVYLKTAFILLTFKANAQFAIITDKDGYVNVRSENKVSKNIQDTLKNGHLIFCFENSDNWTIIDYDKKDKSSNGYIYKDRFKLISDFSKIPIVTQKSNSIKLQKDSIEVIITESKFDKSKHKLKFHKEYKTQLILIDNKQYWGLDGGVPKTEYKSIIVKINSKEIVLPKKAIENLYEVTLFNTEVNYDKTNDTLYVQSMNSDGAGGYSIIWKIKNGKYIERYVAYGF